MEREYLALGAVALLVIFVVLKGKPTATMSNATEQDIEEALRAGKKVTAIKYYRALHGVDLKDAKNAIDALEKTL